MGMLRLFQKGRKARLDAIVKIESTILMPSTNDRENVSNINPNDHDGNHTSSGVASLEESNPTIAEPKIELIYQK